MRKNKAYLLQCFVKHYYGKDGKLESGALDNIYIINNRFEILFKHRKGAEGTAQLLGLHKLVGKEHAEDFLKNLRVSHYRFTQDKICKFFQAWKPFVNKIIKNRLEFLDLIREGSKLRDFIKDMRCKSVEDRTLRMDRVLIRYKESDGSRFASHDIEVTVEYENQERLHSIASMPYWVTGYVRRHITKGVIGEATRYSTIGITVNIKRGKITTQIGK